MKGEVWAATWGDMRVDGKYSGGPLPPCVSARDDNGFAVTPRADAGNIFFSAFLLAIFYCLSIAGGL